MRLAGVGLLLALVGAAGAQEPGSDLRVSLLTMGPGASVYERFGHNALWVEQVGTGQGLVYNYGMFDFGAPGFVTNFVRGRPRYWLGAYTIEQTVAQYERAGRSVVVQELDLTPRERVELATFLDRNAQPDQREYTYDYFLDNCSTRVRDALDRVLGGRLKALTEGRPAEGNFRFHTQRSLTNDPLMYTGILLGQGPRTDEPIDQWAEMFLPAKVQERVRELTVSGADGVTRPLVRSERTILPGVHDVEAAPPAWGPRFATAGVALAFFILLALTRGAGAVIGRVVGIAWLVVCGVGGLVLLFLWVGTNHVFSAANRNLLLLTPLALLLLPAFLSRRGAAPSRIVGGGGALVVVSVLAGSVLALVPSLGDQWNVQVMQFVAAPTVALALVAMTLNRRRAGVPPTPR